MLFQCLCGFEPVCHFTQADDEPKYNLKIIYDLRNEKNVFLRKSFQNWGIEYVECDPASFLRCILDADYIITDSFHATAFSVIFHKEFYTFGRQYGTQNLSVRMEQFLNTIGLLVRYNCDEIVSEELNYELIDSKILPMINDSLDMLREALN